MLNTFFCYQLAWNNGNVFVSLMIWGGNKLLYFALQMLILLKIMLLYLLDYCKHVQTQKITLLWIEMTYSVQKLMKNKDDLRCVTIKVRCSTLFSGIAFLDAITFFFLQNKLNRIKRGKVLYWLKWKSPVFLSQHLH